LLVVFNLSAAAVEWKIPGDLHAQAIDSHGLVAGQVQDGILRLPAQGVFYAAIN